MSKFKAKIVERDREETLKPSNAVRRRPLKIMFIQGWIYFLNNYPPPSPNFKHYYLIHIFKLCERKIV